MKKFFKIASVFVFFTVFVLAAPSVSAHPPSNMTLIYNDATQVLTVTVFHSVTNVDTHYIETIEVSKNGAPETSRSYTFQETSSTVTTTFNINTDDGDVLEVTAICSISGQITRQITVGDSTGTTTPTGTTPTTPTGTTPTPAPPIPGFPLVAIIIGLVAALGITVLRNRRTT